jgi:hypothetical protein
MSHRLAFFIGVLISFFNTGMVFSQDPFYKTYNWEASPKLHTISSYEKEFPALVLKENHVVEFAYENEALTSYILVHKIVKANNDEGIVKNNRIFLPFSDNTNMLVTRARVINSKGIVKELNESDIKVGENKENKSIYRYFALEGLDQGSEIEYIFVIHQEAEYYGRAYQLQNDTYKKDVAFKIISPANLVFKSKSYNKLPDLQASETSDGKNILYVKVDTIPGVKQELFAVYEPNLMQLVFKLYENKSQSQKEVINFVNAATSISGLVCEPVSKSAQKEIKNLIKKIGVEAEKYQNVIVRKVEEYVKMNIAVEEYVPDESKMLDAIFENKRTDRVGITKVFAAIFDELKIDYQLVVTSDRSEVRFDPDFESYSFLDEYLIYFPTTQNYICPAAFASRLGYIPTNFCHNYGLFIKVYKINGTVNGLGEVKFIEPLAYDKTKHNHYVKVDFSKSLDNPTLEYKLVLEGYYAQQFQPYYTFVPADQFKDVDDFIMKNMFPGVTMSEYTIENKGIENYGIKPLIVNARSSSSTMMEKAGNKYLLKIGELIGPQVELYQEEERKFDVENDFNRSYYREITFNIPDGYKVNNLDALNMKVELLEDNGEATSYFTSGYELNKNQVIVKVHEDYKSIYYPKAKFQEYRKVINAAADFNKIVLVLEKK